MPPWGRKESDMTERLANSIAPSALQTTEMSNYYRKCVASQKENIYYLTLREKVDQNLV